MNSITRLREKPWVVFSAIGVGMFLTMMDQSAINIALPEIASDFDAALPDVQWMAVGYGLATGALILPMGKLSDAIGRKRLFVLGLIVISIGAVFAGLAGSLEIAIIARLFQGLGAAMMQANALAIMISVFPATGRGMVIGIFMTIVGVASVIGPAIGGVVVELIGWRWLLISASPLGFLSTGLAFILLPVSESIDIGRRLREFDWLGSILFALILTIFMLTITNGHRIGWTSLLSTVAWLVAVSLTVTLFFQQRHQSVPLIPVHLFRRKLFSMGSGASFFTFLSGTAVFFIMPFYLQGVLGLSPTIAGFVIMPMAGAFALSGPLAGYVSDRFGWTRIELLGLGMAACSLIFLSFIDQKTSLPYLLPFLAMIGMGMGFFYSPNSSSVLSVIDPSDYGVGTAFLNLIRNSANIIGISMATMIITAMMAHYGFEASLDAVNDPNYGEGIKVAFVSGLSLTLRIQGILILASVLLTVSKNINLKR